MSIGTQDGPESRPDSTAPSAEASGARVGRVVLDGDGIRRAIARVAHEIRERDAASGSLALVAVAGGGVPVAGMISEQLEKIGVADVPVGALDVTLYRDDVIASGKRPIPQRTRMPFSVTGRVVVLVEDVVFTGRTVRAAMDAVIDFGRPAAIRVATLIDRGHRELPIRVDFVGKNIPTARAEHVELRRAGDDWEVVVR
jgi:pyrimidine operon attenuation protein/uracil phosphoribosyltransferase